MVTGLIMASGFSNRMGEDKLLMVVDGKPMVEKVIIEAKKSKLKDIILVYRREEVKEIGVKYGIQTIFNPDADEGKAASIKKGIKEVDSRAVMFLTGDQPYLSYELIDELIDLYESGDHKIIVPMYEGRQYIPTIFSMEFKDDFLKIEGEDGGKAIIDENLDKLARIEVKNKKWVLDIDTKEEFKKWG